MTMTEPRANYCALMCNAYPEYLSKIENYLTKPLKFYKKTALALVPACGNSLSVPANLIDAQDSVLSGIKVFSRPRISKRWEV